METEYSWKPVMYRLDLDKDPLRDYSQTSVMALAHLERERERESYLYVHLGVLVIYDLDIHNSLFGPNFLL